MHTQGYYQVPTMQQNTTSTVIDTFNMPVTAGEKTIQQHLNMFME